VDGRAASVQLGVSRLNVVNDSYAVSHHYRSCYGTAHTDGKCDQLLASTYRDDTVLRYRAQLVDSVRRILDSTAVFNATLHAGTE